jgi:hypothetical protein
MYELQHSIRQQLIAAGLRCVAYEFDGCGDSGSVNELLLPTRSPEQALEEYTADSLEDTFDKASQYSYINDKYTHIDNNQYAALMRQIDAIPSATSTLEDMAYSALENFPGDWVNNDGGYGIVAIDLVTGDYRIDGYQRVSDVESAYSSGAFLEPLATDTLSLVKQHLSGGTPRE